MDRQKKINLTMTLGEFLDLWTMCNDLGNPEPLHTIIHRKADAIQKHEIYSKSKTATTEAEREQARSEYLDRVGMSQDFRWSKNPFSDISSVSNEKQED